MPTVAMSGSDTITINNQLFTDLAIGDCLMLTFPNEIGNVKTGKNGNSIYGFNESGKQCDVELHLIRAGADDKFMNSLLSQQQQNFAGTVLMVGQFIKKIGDGRGNITSDTYIMSGGIFIKQVEAKTNVEGAVEQSIAIYKMRFSNSPRTLT